MDGVERRGIQRLLQVHAECHIVEEELHEPLFLAIASRGTEDHEGLALAGDQGRGEGGARAFMGGQGIRPRRIQVEHLAAGPEGNPQALDDRRGANPATAWGGGDHVALAVNGIEMGSITDVGMPESEVPDRPGPDAEGAAVVGSDVDGRIGRDTVAHLPRAHRQRGACADEMASRGGVFAR